MPVESNNSIFPSFLVEKLFHFHNNWKVTIQNLYNLKERISYHQENIYKRTQCRVCQQDHILASNILQLRADIIALKKEKNIWWSQTAIFHANKVVNAVETRKQVSLFCEELLDDKHILEMFITELEQHWEDVCTQVQEDKVSKYRRPSSEELIVLCTIRESACRNRRCWMKTSVPNFQSC